MSAENFHLLDEKIFDNSILKRNFCKIFHQQEVNLNDFDKNIHFIFGENEKNYQIFIAYFQIDLSLKKNVGSFEHDKTDIIRLVNKAFAYFSKEGTIMTTRGSEIELKKLFELFLLSCEF